MRLITLDDIIETYTKFRQRGLPFITSKLSLNTLKRTKSAFNELDIQSANWWIIPKVNQRWNKLISGDPTLEYEDFVMKKFLADSKNLKMLSLGSGISSHELKFARYNNFEEIICLDINEVLFDAAKQEATTQKLDNIHFKIQNLYNYEFPENYFDVVFFHASLHHFKNIEELVGQKIKKTLKSKGKLIINEFVGANRLQFPKHQIVATNKLLKHIPKPYRKRFKLHMFKNRFYGSGIIRMILADPSECIESSQIMPAIHNNYNTIYEASYGGNLLANALKDLSHHFMELDEEKEKVLDHLFELEDKYLEQHPSDFVFGIYES
ncbi:class I SAM-dependent methyltransferase [Aquimarina sp. 2201CG14-23]|uniref:class I SAM-dependent methyltransferase n=1 Tax=Aquimarina mycalae TaxID=3040073 RepID=UPI00247815BC|nr:class I SAM-dependent methyltransferase [Aquimarina sp. 2201CG14-23]MDH7444977.1 class I SAM-dependent methyltransferase [Aquimarina sp. 2201CG14-23]